MWWMLFFVAVGLAIGSYLNVVIYRIPRGISTSAPRWSFCPCCEARIHWYDNLPVLSYVRLGARCRGCGVSISPRYPAVELLMALLALVVLDAFCVAGLRGGTQHANLGITEQLYYDWPIVLAHVILFACLLAMSVVDLEHYFIDVRFTGFAAAAGVVLHVIWTPTGGGWRPTVGLEWYRPGVSTGAVCLAMALVAALVWLVIRWLAPRADEEPASDVTEAPAGERSAEASSAAWLVASAFLVVMVATAVDALSDEPRLFPEWRLAVPLAMCFVLIVGASAPARASDGEIVEAIEAERFSARRVALQEALLLAPAVVAGIIVVGFSFGSDAFGNWCEGCLAWSPHGSWRPVTGLATAASGYVVGAGLGWAVRIGFTLVLGREAFGTGDIHLMAAGGCVAGWPVVVIGFVLTSFLAVAGWLVTLPFKQTRAIPLVPWLSLAFLLVVVFYNRLCEMGPVQNTVYLFEALARGDLAGATN